MVVVKPYLSATYVYVYVCSHRHRGPGRRRCCARCCHRHLHLHLHRPAAEKQNGADRRFASYFTSVSNDNRPNYYYYHTLAW